MELACAGKVGTSASDLVSGALGHNLTAWTIELIVEIMGSMLNVEGHVVAIG
jgi:hypothetical protein